MDNPSPVLTTPVLRIGVTGHRSFADEASVRQALEPLLAELSAMAARVHAQLVAISPLAEGADRLVAEEALALGARLEAPLPFTRDEYEQDFETAESKQAFRRLLAQAGAIYELDGRREDADAAYEAVGRVVLAHSDILIALWDGLPGRGRGGTAQIVAEALAAGVAVVRVDAAGKEDPKVLGAVGAASEPASLEAQVIALLTPPSPPPHALRRAEPSLQALAAETQPAWTLGWVFDLVRDLMLGRLRAPKMMFGNWMQASLASWTAELEVLPPEAGRRLIETLRPSYTWADELATYYAGLYRSGSLGCWLLSAASVMFALAGDINSRFEGAFLLLELLSIAALLLLLWRAHVGCWHERWVQYRQLAEQLRPMRFLFPLDVRLPRPPGSGMELESGQRTSWIDWLSRQVERGLGLPSVAVGPDTLERTRRLVRTELQGQQRYQTENAKRLTAVEHRLRLFGELLFVVVLIACVAHMALWWAAHRLGQESTGNVEGLLRFVAGGLPALGAAFFGIRSLGEFARLSHRSQAMAEALAGLCRRLDELKDEALTRTGLARAAEETAALMMSETADWRTIVILKPLELP